MKLCNTSCHRKKIASDLNVSKFRIIYCTVEQK